jgi:hypothetical protein
VCSSDLELFSGTPRPVRCPLKNVTYLVLGVISYEKRLA